MEVQCFIFFHRPESRAFKTVGILDPLQQLQLIVITFCELFEFSHN
jgi:hypothetical protein